MLVPVSYHEPFASSKGLLVFLTEDILLLEDHVQLIGFPGEDGIFGISLVASMLGTYASANKWTGQCVHMG